MPTLEECSNQIAELVDEKGFNSDILFFKLVWGQIELAEAIDLVKKYGLPDIKIGKSKDWESVPWKIGEEIVDTIFYCCDGYRLLKRKYPALPTIDEMFDYKMRKNMDRPKKYGQKWATTFLKSAVDHFHDEGILDEMITDMLHYASTKKSKHEPVDMTGEFPRYVRYCVLCKTRRKHHGADRGTSLAPKLICDVCGHVRPH